MHKFSNRRDAGRQLAALLMNYKNDPHVLVLALPRGGVPVAWEVAQALHAPLDVFLVRKLGVPGQEELALGAIASGGIVVLNPFVIQRLQIEPRLIEDIAQREEQQLQRRERLYRADRPPPRVQGRTIILIDDGLATGATMRAAVTALRQQQAGRLVVAVPVASPETCADFQAEADEIVCALTPELFIAVGAWYEDFSQTTDEEVRELLQQAADQPRENSRQ